MNTTTLEPPATVGVPEPDRYTALPPQPAAEGHSTGRWNVEGTISRVRADAYDTAVRLRTQIAPHAITGSILVAGLGMDAVVAAGGVSAPAMALMAGAASATSVAGMVLRARRRGSEWARRILLGGAAATGWLVAAPYGVDTVGVAALVAGEYAVAARWWQTRRPGYPTDSPAEKAPVLEPVPEPLTPVEQIVADWDEYIACQGGPLQNSRLIAPQKHKHGYAFTLQLWRGRHTLTNAIAALDRLASGLACRVDEIIVESHPLLKDEASCRFQFLTSSPIAGNLVFDGPRRSGGLLDLGPYADGSGEAQYRLYTPGSMWSGVIIGGTGIGKSRVAENIVISAISGGDTVYWFIDGQNGSSSPALRDNADWYGGNTDAPSIADAAVAILDARSEENAVMGWTGFTPSPRRPGLLIVIDESHNPFKESVEADKYARIAREGRKVGLGLLVIDQFPHVKTFGGSEELRSSVMEGNALVFRSTSHSTGQLMPGLTVDPKTLPKIPGYGYVQGSEETGLRTAPFRNRDTNAPGGPGPSRWLAAQKTPELDVLSATATLAAGTAYQDRRTSTTTGQAGSRARVEALRNGHLPADMLKGTTGTAQAPTIAQVIEFPTFKLIEQGPSTTREGSELSSSHQAVLDAVNAGCARPADIEQRVGLKHRRVAAILADLVQSGRLTKTGHGRYQAAA